MIDDELIDVEVAYAAASRQRIVPVRLPRGSSAMEAARRSGLVDEFPGLALDHSRLGVFGQPVRPDYALRPGDRVEIYRPLELDPKELRRRRARNQDR